VSRFIGSILPVTIWDKVEDFGEDRTGDPDKAKTKGFGPNRPGPQGLRLAGTHFVGKTWPMNHIDLRRPSRGSPRKTRNRMNLTMRDTR
jgi:hypothetical protein